MRAGGRPQWWELCHHPRGWPTLSAPLQSVLARRLTAAPRWRRARVRLSPKAVWLCPPPAASPCWPRSLVPQPTRGWTLTRRRRRTVLTTGAESSWGKGLPQGWGRGPVAWRRAGGLPEPQGVSTAGPASLRPAVQPSGPQPGAHPWTTGGPTRWASARGRGPLAGAQSSGLAGSRPVHPQGREPSRRWLAWSARLAPLLTPRPTADHASRGHWCPGTGQSKEAAKALSGAAAAPHPGQTGLGAPSHTRAGARRPTPSAQHTSTRTIRATATCGPGKRREARQRTLGRPDSGRDATAPRWEGRWRAGGPAPARRERHSPHGDRQASQERSPAGAGGGAPSEQAGQEAVAWASWPLAPTGPKGAEASGPHRVWAPWSVGAGT